MPQLPRLHCNQCAHGWVPRIDPEDVRICPSCKSIRWDKPGPHSTEAATVPAA